MLLSAHARASRKSDAVLSSRDGGAGVIVGGLIASSERADTDIQLLPMRDLNTIIDEYVHKWMAKSNFIAIYL